MAPSSRDRISVDLHGLRAALLERARARRVSVSLLVREAIERELDPVDESEKPDGVTPVPAATGATVRSSIRLTVDEAARLDGAARRSGLSRGAFVSGLLSGTPAMPDGGASRPDRLAALTASNSELSTLSRNIHQLTALLRQGDVPAAERYRRMLDSLGDDIRAHLGLAASALATLRPARSPASAASRKPA